jgi:hypothetical protein
VSRRIRRVCAAGVAIGAVLVATPVGAEAGTMRPDVCNPPGYLTSESGTYIGNPANRTYGQYPGTIIVSKGTTKTVSGSLQTTVSAEAGVIFAKVSTSIGLSVGLSRAVTTDSSYSWAVPKSQATGYVEMGSHGYRISWRYGSYNSSCQFVTQRTGQLSGVTANVEFTHS